MLKGDADGIKACDKKEISKETGGNEAGGKKSVPEEGGEEDEGQFISETQGKGNDDPVDQSLYGKGGA
jgi:hypothetical protein